MERESLRRCKMNYKQANAVKHLAPGVMKVLKRLEWIEYLKEQKGGIAHHYSWTPQVGEWCIEKGKCHLIVDVRENKHPGEIWINTSDIYATTLIKIDELTPILPWETIENVLEKAGYYFTRGWEGIECENVLYIQKEGDYQEKLQIEIDFRGCSRQEAVMKAVLELGKESK